jgi:hypothetical protein
VELGEIVLVVVAGVVVAALACWLAVTVAIRLSRRRTGPRR